MVVHAVILTLVGRQRRILDFPTNVRNKECEQTHQSHSEMLPGHYSALINNAVASRHFSKAKHKWTLKAFSLNNLS